MKTLFSCVLSAAVLLSSFPSSARAEEPAPEAAPPASTSTSSSSSSSVSSSASPVPDPEPTTLKDALEPLEIGGYVQGRFVWNETSTHDDVRDGFTVRRARLKLTYMGEHGGALLQVDASPRGLTLKDAEARLMVPWTGRKLMLAAGQMKWPFGFEVPQSSSKREFPERTRAIRAFLAGERDRGARLSGKFGIVEFSGGVFDGNGVDDRAFFGEDNDRYKDVVGRVGVKLGRLSGGVSGWYGRTVRPLVDREAPQPAVDRTFDRTRIGADAQLKLGLLPFGDTALKVEWIAGRSYWDRGEEQHGAEAMGGYGLLTQALPMRNLIALRYDVFAPEGDDDIHTAGVAFVHEWSKHVKLTAAYEVPMTRGAEGVVDRRDNVFTLQLQGSY